MTLRLTGLLFSAGLLLSAAAQAGDRSTLACRMNSRSDTCVITPEARGGFRIQFQGGDQAFFVFTPAGPATTLDRPMDDAQGRRWLMTGHHSFSLREVGGDGNVIEVTAP